MADIQAIQKERREAGIGGWLFYDIFPRDPIAYRILGLEMDDFETCDTRRLVPRTCFSVEPGIDPAEFEIRCEADVYRDGHGARVTGAVQQRMIPLLAAGAGQRQVRQRREK